MVRALDTRRDNGDRICLARRNQRIVPAGTGGVTEWPLSNIYNTNAANFDAGSLNRSEPPDASYFIHPRARPPASHSGRR